MPIVMTYFSCLWVRCALFFLLGATFLLPFDALALEIDEREYKTAIEQECHGCHFDNRMKPVGKLPNGSRKWTDQKCVACHTEIDDIAYNYRNNIKDARYVALPVKDKRLESMEKYPLSYLHAPIWPIFKKQSVRVNRKTLAQFLNAPHGKCTHDECDAPKMMAYTQISEDEVVAISEHLKVIPVESEKEVQGSPTRGRALFEKSCSMCHGSSQLSGYNANAMSLFSADWIYEYANGKEVEGRVMPKMPVSKEQAHDLYAYFQSSREENEKALATSVSQIKKEFASLPKGKIPPNALNFIWNRLWRDTGCVHCHGIEGRAKEKFNMATRTDIEEWLRESDPSILYQRLAIRGKEKEFGMGATPAGMPATGQPLPEQLIKLLGIWIKSGCPNEENDMICKE
ncbi:putative Cytochrome c, monohaem [Vibrio nigripulchritudo SFn27]|uniref:Putative Cytochrome c, monohaem n=2 Tax=Vibrio nigripulchritudo TaxID=28173 RepID=U4K6F8_9VIBR|nr:putative Cytochrome c, monohaem [Vibrio nigripulchritudo BLFn1]CCN89793.1 putative Cytochrome c, monohaem [Vibrio nigripulchritudo SFn27]CCN92190.1 putative Cytochrome c, monohaem [Vibrio nigripulchritudo ENn2]CCO43676.1 putative Cytochrome c, monohaem [Vibrio nigripulchritudo SFn135]CCO52991.1 putative Cytochrome c, monohaem [Vibrio nigripulchritudo Wn13]CCO58229.1 putative Cytochrome c, monohaem [Vibrio nigripulchritudo]